MDFSKGCAVGSMVVGCVIVAVACSSGVADVVDEAPSELPAEPGPEVPGEEEQGPDERGDDAEVPAKLAELIEAFEDVVPMGTRVDCQCDLESLRYSTVEECIEEHVVTAEEAEEMAICWEETAVEQLDTPPAGFDDLVDCLVVHFADTSEVFGPDADITECPVSPSEFDTWDEEFQEDIDDCFEAADEEALEWFDDLQAATWDAGCDF